MTTRASDEDAYAPLETRGGKAAWKKSGPLDTRSGVSSRFGRGPGRIESSLDVKVPTSEKGAAHKWGDGLTVSGASATVAQPVSLADAGLKERGHLQVWGARPPGDAGPRREGVHL